MGRINEISRKGCYVDNLNPFPVGTNLNVVISRDYGSFATKGNVIYAHEGIGMGVAFLDPTDGVLGSDSFESERTPVGVQYTCRSKRRKNGVPSSTISGLMQ